jgi:hypothetical protein
MFLTDLSRSAAVARYSFDATRLNDPMLSLGTGSIRGRRPGAQKTPFPNAMVLARVELID